MVISGCEYCRLCWVCGNSIKLKKTVRVSQVWYPRGSTVKQKLILHETFLEQLRENYKNGKQHKKTLTTLLSGKLLEKYKLTNCLSKEVDIYSGRRERKKNKSCNFSQQSEEFLWAWWHLTSCWRKKSHHQPKRCKKTKESFDRQSEKHSQKVCGFWREYFLFRVLQVTSILGSSTPTFGSWNMSVQITRKFHFHL